MGRVTEFLVFINDTKKDLEWDYAYIDPTSPYLKSLRKEYRRNLKLDKQKKDEK